MKHDSGSARAQETLDLYNELRAEIEALAKATAKDSEPTIFPDPVGLSAIERRVLVKSIFSYTEAMSFSLKRLALADGGELKLTLGERALAAEESYEINHAGKAETRRAKLRTLNNIRFCFNIFAKINQIDFSLDVSGEEWRLLQSSVKVRDRLTHPKSLSDLSVNDEEIREVLRAFIWFESQTLRMLLTLIVSERKKLDRFKQL